ncbi:MAG: GldG family protein [Bryobacteraceae bacterium]
MAVADIFKAKQTKFGGYVVLYTAIILAMLGILNFLANRHNKSFDSTANKRFSLSDQTTKVVSGLKQDVVVQYFDRTSAFASAGGAKDLLDRYNNLSPKLSVEYIDPEKQPQIARAEGVRTLGTTYVKVGSRREEAKSVTEEEVTGALVRALKGGKRTVCSVKGLGERDLEGTGSDGYSQLKEYLERNNYQTRSISLLEKAEIPPDCTIVMVAGPQRDYPQAAVDAIRKNVEEGGRALIMLDPPFKFAADETDPNDALAKVAADWGVTLNKNLVLDMSPIGQMFGLGPQMPLANEYGTHAIVRDMKGTASAIPLTRSLEVKSGDKTSVEKLVSTGSSAIATTQLSSREVDPNKGTKGQFTLAAAGTYNTGKEKTQGRFVITGSAGFASNGFLRFGGNRDLTMNMMNWLSADEDLISIRPKDPEDRRISMNASQMRMVFLGSIIFLPVLFMMWGVSVWWKRR